jgi:hypothetical protein
MAASPSGPVLVVSPTGMLGANTLLGAPTITVTEWCEARTGEERDG